MPPQHFFAAIAALLPLAACGSPDAFPPACPSLSLLPDAADLRRFNGSGRDITDLVLDARIVGVPARCKQADKQTVRAVLHVDASLARGPSGPPTASVPYFVAVTQDGRVLDEQDYALNVRFPPNTDQVTTSGQDITLDLPVTATRSAAAYTLYVSFRLSPEELAANRAARTP